MKTGILVLLFLLGRTIGNGQRQFIMWPTDANTDKIVFTESVPFVLADQSVLFTKAVNFFKNTYKGEKDTVIIDDNTETIVCKSAFFIPIPELGEKGKGFISYTFKVWCHKNYYRYSLFDLYHKSEALNGANGGPLESEKTISGAMLFPDRYWNAEKGKCYYQIQTTIEQFKTAMKLANNQ